MYPIGLISADEVAYAGGESDLINESYYLYTKQYYWTMTPLNSFYNSAGVALVTSNGWFGRNTVAGSFGIRPVINLKANVTISGGNGSSSNPYVIA